MRNRDFWFILLGLAIGIPVGIVILQAVTRPAGVPSQATAVIRPVQNKEVWAYTDWRGRERRIEVHRAVE